MVKKFMTFAKKLSIVVVPLIAAVTTSLSLAVPVCPAGEPFDEYRHKTINVHFMTACTDEKTAVISSGAFENTQRTIPNTAATRADAVGLIRYFIDFQGTVRHFYTVIPRELEIMTATLANPASGVTREGERGKMIVPLNISTTTGGDIDNSAAACPAASIPVYRAFVKSPPQHRYSTKISEHQAFVSAGADSEGIRMCAPITAGALSLNAVGPSAPIELGINAQFDFTLVDTAAAPNFGGAVIKVRLPAKMNWVSDSGIGPCVRTGTASEGQLLTCVVNGSPSTPPTLRVTAQLAQDFAVTSYQLKALVTSVAGANFAEPEACSGGNVPMYGCAVANGTRKTTSGGNASFALNSAPTLSDKNASTGGTFGNFDVVVTGSADSSGKPLNLFLLLRETGTQTWQIASAVPATDRTIPAATESRRIAFSTSIARADAMVCASSESPAAFGLLASCQTPSADRKLSPIASNIALSDSAPQVTVAVSAPFSLPSGVQGNFYSGFSFGCSATPASALVDVCNAQNLPSPLSATCGALPSNSVNCTVGGATLASNAATTNVTFNATSGNSADSQIRLLSVEPPANTLGGLSVSAVSESDKVSATGNNSVTLTFNVGAASGSGSASYVLLTSADNGATWTSGGSGAFALSAGESKPASINISTASSTIQVRGCAVSNGGFGAGSACAGTSTSAVRGAILTVTFGPPPPPAATAILSIGALSGAPAVGGVTSFTVSTRSKLAAPSQVTGALSLYVPLPNAWSFDAAGSAQSCSSMSGIRAVQCTIQSSGTLSDTQSVDIVVALKPLPGSGGVQTTIYAIAAAPSNAAPPTSCNPANDGCASTTAAAPSFYDLSVTTQAIALPTISAGVTAQCGSSGGQSLIATPSCNVAISYSDNSTPLQGSTNYTSLASGAIANLKICLQGDNSSDCTVTIPTGKTVSKIELTATDAPSGLENNTANNTKVVYQTTSGLSCTSEAQPSQTGAYIGNPVVDSPSKYVYLLNNEVYTITLSPGGWWRTVGRTLANSFKYNQNSSFATRDITISRCPGSFTASADTYVLQDGTDGRLGDQSFYAGEPNRANPFEPNLAGLDVNTTWYINFRQKTCGRAPSRCELYTLMTYNFNF
jgi:hypothetical protein